MGTLRLCTHPPCLCLLESTACLFAACSVLSSPGRRTRTPRLVAAVCLKDHSLTWLAERSANIAALLFLLVSFHTSLTATTSLPDMESGTRRVRPPMTRTHSDTATPSTLPLLEQVGLLSLPVFSRLFQRCQSRSRGKSKSWAGASQTERERGH